MHYYLLPKETEMAEIFLYEAPRCESVARAEQPPIAIG